MKKKIVMLILATTMAASIFTGCRSSALPFIPFTEQKADTDKEADTNTDVDASASDETATDSTDKKELSVQETETNQDTTVTDDKQETSASLGDKWVDIDNMQFTVNGHVYTLGKSTLQDMINDGCPFEENDLANAGNNLNSNFQSQGFRINLGEEYWNAQVYTANYTDGNVAAKDCPITEIYLPNHTDEKQNVLEFAFPLTMTEEDLKNNAGEPTDTSNYDDGDYHQKTYEYKRDSTEYFGDAGYKFEFTNRALKYVTIEYLP